MGKERSQRFLREFMKRFPHFESMQAGNVEIRDDVNKLNTFRQILVTSEAELNAVEKLANTFSYTGEVRFPTNLDADLKNELETMAAEKGLKVSEGQRPPAAANRE